MQKWGKFLLVSLLFLGVLGWLIGLFAAKSGIDQIKILANIDIFSFIELILLIIVITCAIFDIYETYKSNNKFCIIKFKIILNSKKIFKNILIFLVLLSISELCVFVISIDMHMVPLFLITFILALIFAIHNSLDDYINDNGILHWGIYYSWNDIKSYNIKNETLLEINVINNFICFEYNNTIKFNFDEKVKDDMNKFILEKL